MNVNKSAIVLASGGMDSTVLLSLLHKQGWYVQPVSFRYGGKHNRAEFNALKKVCSVIGVPQPIRLNLGFIEEFFKSDLLQSGGDLPHGHYAQANMIQTIVPARNAIMLSIASGLAESLGYSFVAIANHAGDHFIYPDCRTEFVETMSEAFRLGSGEKVKGVYAPFSEITKADIAKLGVEINAPLHLSWSCYEGEGDSHCGGCGTCVERHWAFLKAGVEDPTEYRSDPKEHFRDEEKEDLGIV